MRYLIDTHIGIWMVTQPQLIKDSIKELLINQDNEILISTVSFWEISIKYGLGKLTLNGASPEIIKRELEVACGVFFLDLNIGNYSGICRFKVILSQFLQLLGKNTAKIR